ncbi:MAG TPA: formylglycine-generating enzyme family protein, partial [Blastocatellia bacterium]|nr:formylglycine-generating enzyme family protein [Blastocatellia bacterium]
LIDQEKSASEPAARMKTLRAALGAIAVNLIVALLAYLLWNLALLAYLFWNLWIPATSTKDNAARANPPIVVGAEPTPSPAPAASYVVLHARIEMIYVPGGSFLMGSPENEPGRRSSEGPQHHVTVPSFYIGKYEVTQAQWRAVISGNQSYFEGDDLPEYVSWNDAKEFCRKLSQMTGAEYRLPTEAEWEYACRAKTDGAYAGDLGAMAWYSENSGGRIHPIGQKRPNAFGLYDMQGNVSEWCEDYWHDDYANAPSDGSAWVNTHERGSGRVYRGGLWNSTAAECRSASRNNAFLPDGGLDLAWGFRLARTYH